LATLRSAALIGSAAMFALTLLCQWQPQWFMRPFADNAQAAEVATGFLRIVSWNFVASGLIFTCSGMFQALGNTRPALYASASRLLTFALPAIWLSQHPGFEVRQLWLLSVATTVLQALTVLWLLRRELRRRLPAMAQAAAM
ncbi:MATE family efflux transporter, partial [Staphylococcus pseudintermedius]